MRSAQKDQRASELGSPHLPRIWRRHTLSKALQPIVLGPATQRPRRCTPPPPLLPPRNSTQVSAPSSAESKMLRSLDPCCMPLRTWSSAFVPGLVVVCRPRPECGNEGSATAEMPTLREGHLAWLGVGLTLLTSQYLVSVILGCWERGQRRVPEDRVLFFGSYTLPGPYSYHAFFICAFPQSLKVSLSLNFQHCLLSGFYHCCLFSPELSPCPWPSPVYYRILGEQGGGKGLKVKKSSEISRDSNIGYRFQKMTTWNQPLKVTKLSQTSNGCGHSIRMTRSLGFRV